jgi:hypothetical protein
MPKEILSEDQIKEIASAIPLEEMSLSESEEKLRGASADIQRLIKRIWNTKLEAERLRRLGIPFLVGAEKPAKNSTKRR